MKTNKSIFLVCLVMLVPVWMLSCDIKPSKPSEANLEGVSFQYKSDWESKTKVLSPDLSYYFDCGSGFDTFILSLIKDTFATEIFLHGYLDKIQAQSDYSSTPIVSDKFGSYDCKSSNYTFSVKGTTFYGTVCSFQTNGKTLLVVRQSNTEGQVKSNFKMIEDSFKVDSIK